MATIAADVRIDLFGRETSQRGLFVGPCSVKCFTPDPQLRRKGQTFVSCGHSQTDLRSDLSGAGRRRHLQPSLPPPLVSGIGTRISSWPASRPIDGSLREVQGAPRVPPRRPSNFWRTAFKRVSSDKKKLSRRGSSAAAGASLIVSFSRAQFEHARGRSLLTCSRESDAQAQCSKLERARLRTWTGWQSWSKRSWDTNLCTIQSTAAQLCSSNIDENKVTRARVLNLTRVQSRRAKQTRPSSGEGFGTPCLVTVRFKFVCWLK